MTVATSWIRIAFNRSARRNWHGSGIALITVSREVHFHHSLIAIHDKVGNSHIRALILSRAEVGMHTDGAANKIDDVARVRVDRRGGDVLIPETVVSERTESAEAAALTWSHHGAGEIAA